MRAAKECADVATLDVRCSFLRIGCDLGKAGPHEDDGERERDGGEHKIGRDDAHRLVLEGGRDVPAAFCAAI